MDPDRSAAYLAARGALESIERANWPPEVARPAAQFANDIIDAIKQSLRHGPTTPARRRCLRAALLGAIELTAICEIARVQGLAPDDSLESASRMLSLIGLAHQATCIRIA